jgi:hypothetical protein
MKKWLWVTVAVIIAAFAGVYIFIPARLNIVQITPINCTVNGAFRVLSSSDKWQHWWPGPPPKSNTFYYNNASFAITQQLRNTLEISIQQDDQMLSSALHVFPAGGDSASINWSCNIATGSNPFKRIQHYRQAMALKNSMDSVLSHFKTFAEKKENIYGITFRETVFRDSFLVSIKSFQRDYPDVAAVYSTINALQKYSTIHQAKQTGNPLMNLTPLSPTGYQLMTALPVDRQVPAGGKFFNQRIPLNRFWVTRVQGGNASVDEAIHQFQLYVQDYKRTVMALPFQQLITDRSAEPDTSRWVTDVYFPLF